ncbi:MAG: hypothetical protein ACLSH6_06990 [Limosilactobacillus pontis]
MADAVLHGCHHRTALGARRLSGILKDNGARQTWIQPLDTSRGED